MTDAVKGQTIVDVSTLFDRVHTMLTLPLDRPVETEGIGKLAVLSGVREFPVRIKCASLAWHTLKAALAASPDVVKTE
jgi:nitrogen fixation NifU-like protein